MRSLIFAPFFSGSICMSDASRDKLAMSKVCKKVVTLFGSVFVSVS